MMQLQTTTFASFAARNLVGTLYFAVVLLLVPIEIAYTALISISYYWPRRLRSRTSIPGACRPGAGRL